MGHPVNKHVKHQDFDVELKILHITNVLRPATSDQRRAVIAHLAPIAVKRAVANEFDIVIE